MGNEKLEKLKLENGWTGLTLEKKAILKSYCGILKGDEKMSNETVTILKSEYDQLVEDSELLNCLTACGVDNWDGWDSAIDMMNEEE